MPAPEQCRRLGEGAYEEGMTTVGDGEPMHVSRFGSAAVGEVLRLFISDEAFNPKKLDDTQHLRGAGRGESDDRGAKWRVRCSSPNIVSMTS